MLSALCMVILQCNRGDCALKGATSFTDRGSYECDQIRVRLCLLSLVD